MWVVIAEKQDVEGNKWFEVLGCFYLEKHADIFKNKKIKEWGNIAIKICYAEILD